MFISIFVTSHRLLSKNEEGEGGKRKRNKSLRVAYSELVKFPKVALNFNFSADRKPLRWYPFKHAVVVRMDSWRYRVALGFLFSSIRGITGRKRHRISGPKTVLKLGPDRRVAPKSAFRTNGSSRVPRDPMDRAGHGPRMATEPARAYAYASNVNLHSNCRTIWQTCHYDSVRNRAIATEETSASRNEVPKSPGTAENGQ